MAAGEVASSPSGGSPVGTGLSIDVFSSFDARRHDRGGFKLEARRTTQKSLDPDYNGPGLQGGLRSDGNR